mgnify:CR=1 FL=1
MAGSPSKLAQGLTQLAQARQEAQAKARAAQVKAQGMPAPAQGAWALAQTTQAWGAAVAVAQVWGRFAKTMARATKVLARDGLARWEGPDPSLPPAPFGHGRECGPRGYPWPPWVLRYDGWLRRHRWPRSQAGFNGVQPPEQRRHQGTLTLLLLHSGTLGRHAYPPPQRRCPHSRPAPTSKIGRASC